jgi:sugar phosphate isomerase/epimerase
MPRSTRRRFLKAAGGAALVLGSGARARAGSDKFGGFLMGIQSYTLREFSAEDVLQFAHDEGLGSIEFFDRHFSIGSSDEAIQAMCSRAEGLGIKILGHGVNAFTKDHAANRRIFEFARKVGIRNISADPHEDSFDSLEKLVAEYQIRIAIHNHGPGARYDKVADVLNAIRDRHELIGACADLGHYIRSAEDPVRAIYLLKGRLFGIHLKDFAEPKADAKGVILGKGQLDVEGVFTALREVEFPADGSLSLEYEENPQDPREDVRECLAIAAEAAQRTRGASG